MSADRAYLEAQGVEKAIATALAQVIKEKPPNALARLSQLLSPAPPPTSDYLSTIGNTPMVQLSKLLPPEAKAKVTPTHNHVY